MITKPRSRSLSLNQLVNRITAPVLKKRGFRDVQIIENWSEIVCPQLAALSLPEKLSHRGRDGAVLTVRVEGAMALELQHMVPQILERINQFYGRDAISRLQIIQGPLPMPARRPKKIIIDEENKRAAEQYVEDFPDGPLRSALSRLGGQVLQRHRKNNK